MTVVAVQRDPQQQQRPAPLPRLAPHNRYMKHKGRARARGTWQPPLQSHRVVRDAMLIALSGAWCFVKKKI